MILYAKESQLYGMIENEYSNSGLTYSFLIGDGYAVDIPGYFVSNFMKDYEIDFSDEIQFIASKKIGREKGRKYPRIIINNENISSYFISQNEYYRDQKLAIYIWTLWHGFGIRPENRFEVGIMKEKWAYGINISDMSAKGSKRRISAKSFKLITELNYEDINHFKTYIELSRIQKNYIDTNKNISEIVKKEVSDLNENILKLKKGILDLLNKITQEIEKEKSLTALISILGVETYNEIEKGYKNATDSTN